LSYLVTFAVALLAATLLPVSSEATLLFYLAEGSSVSWLLLFATLGNTLGSIINYTIGFKGAAYLLSHDKISPRHFERSKSFFEKYGFYTLLLSWVPVIGDPITLVAGVLRYRFWIFVSVVALAKGGRYLAIVSAFGYL